MKLPRPIPSPVAFRQEPEGVALGDPAFEALPGARADFGRLGGVVYQISEIVSFLPCRTRLHTSGSKTSCST